MSTLRPDQRPGGEVDARTAELRQRWVAQYGSLVAGQLEPDRRYSLVKVGSVQFAYTSYERHVRALKQIWTARLVPEPLPSVLGRELLEVAPHLQGVDADLEGLRRRDVAGSSRFS